MHRSEWRVADFEGVGARDVFPVLEVGGKICFVCCFIVSDVGHEEWQPFHFIRTSFVVGHHDEGIVDVLVDPVPDIFDVLERFVVDELENHLLCAVHGLELIGKAFHGDDVLVLLGKVDREVGVDHFVASCSLVSVILVVAIPDLHVPGAAQ